MTPAEHTAPTPPNRALRILYAEDVKELRSLLITVLSRDGHSVETACDGGEALQRLTQPDSPQAFDVLITDHHMPRVNGLELVQRVRQLQLPFKIMVFSSEISHSVRDQYEALAVDCILPKPVFPVQLRTALRELYETPGA